MTFCLQEEIPPRMKLRRTPRPLRWTLLTHSQSHDFICHYGSIISYTVCECVSATGEVCSSRVGAGPAEEDPVVRVPPEEAGGGALGSPALPRRQGTLVRIPQPSVWRWSSYLFWSPSGLSHLNSGRALGAWTAVPVLSVGGRLGELWTGQNS